MNKFILTSITFLCCLLLFVNNVTAAENTPTATSSLEDDDFKWENYKKPWMDDIQIHGFLSQGLFSTSGNNVYGKSKDSVSAGSTEVGLNISYQALNNLSFAVQGLYRRAGESTGSEGKVSLDFAFIDYTFFRHQAGRFGVRVGRVKNPWGLYNETRDVAATHPTILLPLAYYERSRALFVSMDGGQLYSDYNTDVGNFTFKFNLGLPASDKELLAAITANPLTPGNLNSDLSLLTSLNYEIDNGKYIFAFSYTNISLGYDGEATDPYIDLNSKINSFMLSAQYNGERLSLTAEYALQWNQFNQLPTPFPGIKVDVSPVSEHWYVQAGYRILDNLQATLRYDSSVQDISDRKGIAFNQSQPFLPAHIMFTQDIVFGMRWDITPAWMLRAEYHRVHGSSNVSAFDNPDFTQQAEDWNIYALQLAYRF